MTWVFTVVFIGNFRKYICDMETSSKILIVDDDVIVTSTLKNVLELEGFEFVEYFNNPKDALNYLKKETVSVIISDFLMPEMNGIQFLAQARKICPNASTILLTGYADKESAIKAINEVGLYKYIEKPWDNDALVLSIKNGIERSSLISNLQQKVNELEIANTQIEKYSKSLENLVAEKTANLIETNNKLSAIINFCADGILTIECDGTILKTNPAFENISGKSTSLLIKHNIFDIVNFKSTDYVQKQFLKSEEFFVRDAVIKNCVNNKDIPLEISFSPIISDTQEQTGFVCVLRDVHLQKDLDRLRDDFIATLTHDLRTPLLASIQALEFFLDGTLGPLEQRQEKILDTMKRSNEDILGLVNALLEVYKYESGKINLYKSNFCINELCEYVKQELQPLVEKRNLTFDLNIDTTENMQIFADKKEIRRVLVNLCANAINHNRTGKNVQIRTTIQNKDLMISVKDDGSGIEKSDIPKMFQRFSQVSTTKMSIGTGLGLYLSRQITEAHGGKIWVESDKKNGTEFFILMPDVLADKTVSGVA